MSAPLKAIADSTTKQISHLEAPRKFILLFSAVLTVSFACGGASGITGSDAPKVSPTPPEPVPPVPSMAGTWHQSAPSAGISNFTLVLTQDASDSLSGTWTLTRSLCNCEITGTVLKKRSYRTRTYAHIEFVVERNGYGVLDVNLEGDTLYRGFIQLEYDQYPDSELREGPIVLTRSQ